MSRAADRVAEVYREEWGRVLASLIRFAGDFDRAEDALQDAFAAAIPAWESNGVPDHPAAWLARTARRRLIDRARRGQRERAVDPAAIPADDDPDPRPIEDHRLRLMFTCCHPALARETQVGLTLRTLGGLGTEQIARAFLVTTPTMAQRLARAKRKIREAGIPYEVPGADELPRRVPGVLSVIYLVFNAGHVAQGGPGLVDADLCTEAIRLARLLVHALPDAREARGLLALLLLQDSRRAARVDADGGLVRLPDQDRTRWDHDQITEAAALLARSDDGDPGPYELQARIAHEHARAPRAVDTDWHRIVALYDALEARAPSPVVRLNRAVALAEAEGPTAGLEAIDALAGDLGDYPYLHVARGELLARQGRLAPARAALREALRRTENDVERRHLQRRIQMLGAPGPLGPSGS